MLYLKLTLSVLFFLINFSFSCIAQNSTTGTNDTIFTVHPLDKNLVTMEVITGSGKLVTTGRLFHGKKHGIFRTYDDHSNISEIQEFYEDIPDGIYLKFATNGALNSEENYLLGKLHGKKVIYRFGGIKKLIENYSDGKLDGLRTAYYDNGFKQEEGSYKSGLRNGITRWYNQSEIVTIEYTYSNGKLNGPARTCHFGGKTESEGNYSNDVETGEWKYYDETGKHIRSGFYKEGKLIREIKK